MQHSGGLCFKGVHTLIRHEQVGKMSAVPMVLMSFLRQSSWMLDMFHSSVGRKYPNDTFVVTSNACKVPTIVHYYTRVPRKESKTHIPT